MDGHHRVAGLDERIDEEPRRSLDGDRQTRRSAEAPQTAPEFGQSLGAVCDDEARADQGV